MPTKYARERPLRGAAKPPFLRQQAPRQLSKRARLNLVVIVICLMLFALRAVGPLSQQRAGNRSLGAALVVAKDQGTGKEGQPVYWLQLRLLSAGENTTPLRAAVDGAVWLGCKPGDKLAVVYAPAIGLAPARVFEIGTAPLEGASATE